MKLRDIPDGVVELDEELATLMIQAGLKAIKVGIENSNHELLKEHDRNPPQKAHQEKLIRFLEDRGVKVIAFYVLGLSNDTTKSIEDTIEYSIALDTSFANFTICTPIPGTKFFDEVKDKIFDQNFQHYDNITPVFKTNYLSASELIRYQEKAFFNFYFRPKKWMKHLRYLIS